MNFASVSAVTLQPDNSRLITTDRDPIVVEEGPVTLALKFNTMMSHSTFSSQNGVASGFSAVIKEDGVIAVTWARNNGQPVIPAIIQNLGAIHLTCAESTILEVDVGMTLGLYGTLETRIFNHLIKEATGKAGAEGQIRVTVKIHNNRKDNHDPEDRFVILAEHGKRIPVAFDDLVISAPL